MGGDLLKGAFYRILNRLVHFGLRKDQVPMQVVSAELVCLESAALHFFRSESMSFLTGQNTSECA
jgi:hypothetical protein